jgi:RND family efflux transporter MFP subunit
MYQSFRRETQTMSPTRSLLATLVALMLSAPAAQAAKPALAAAPAQPAAGVVSLAFDGVVEAVRQTVIAAQVAGAVVQLDVKVGDRVKAGAVLLRIDARAADQNAAASDAQVMSARALQEAATRDFERQKQLFQKNYISQAALDQAESQFKATQAQVAAQLAQAGAARTQTGLHIVRAPYAGVVSEVPVALGDMAMPGRPLITLYDPSALRITAAVPQSVAAQWQAQAAGAQPVRLELPGLPAAQQWVTPGKLQLLPTVDAATHTAQMRADLPANITGLAPGLFARLWLPVASSQASGAPPKPVTVPLSAVVRRAELTAVYVLDPQGKPVLRQVRLGSPQGDRVEVLSGVAPGEPVVADPQAAARVR